MTSAANIDARFERFVAIDAVSGCHVWTGARDVRGYGRIADGKRGWVAAYRWSYERRKGEIPAGLVIDHLCRRPSCVNPDHLEAVTTRENTLRGVSFAAVNAAKTHCDHGHPYDTANTYIRPNGYRDCRKCTASRQRAYRQRRAA